MLIAEWEVFELDAMTISYREAVRIGMRTALQRDPRVFLMGKTSASTAAPMPAAKGFSMSSALNGFETRRCQRAPSSALASARRSAACGRSWRS